jgi:hypothetical protein
MVERQEQEAGAGGRGRKQRLETERTEARTAVVTSELSYSSFCCEELVTLTIFSISSFARSVLD